MAIQEKARVRAPNKRRSRLANTDKPLTLAALKGKVVLLDFWTYGCINCSHHSRPQAVGAQIRESTGRDRCPLGEVRKREGHGKTFRRIILRYEIEHPVYTTPSLQSGAATPLTALPTQVLIDPAGYIIGGISGEATMNSSRPTSNQPAPLGNLSRFVHQWKIALQNCVRSGRSHDQPSQRCESTPAGDRSNWRSDQPQVVL